MKDRRTLEMELKTTLDLAHDNFLHQQDRCTLCRFKSKWPECFKPCASAHGCEDYLPKSKK